MTTLNASSADLDMAGYSYDYRGRRVEKVLSRHRRPHRRHRPRRRDARGVRLRRLEPHLRAHRRARQRHAPARAALRLGSGRHRDPRRRGRRRRPAARHRQRPHTTPGGTTTTRSIPVYDGNGNIIALVDGGTGPAGGTVVAEFSYGPYGTTVSTTGAADRQDDCPFRFSTKYLDDAEGTGHYYYGYRYYQPDTGTWLGRDPLGEEGGLNLYGFVSNDPVNSWDYLGLEVIVSVKLPKVYPPGSTFDEKEKIDREAMAIEQRKMEQNLEELGIEPYVSISKAGTRDRGNILVMRGQLKKIADIEDPLIAEIYWRMIATSRTFDFNSVSEFNNHVLLRGKIVALARKIAKNGGIRISHTAKDIKFNEAIWEPIPIEYNPSEKEKAHAEKLKKDGITTIFKRDHYKPKGTWKNPANTNLIWNRAVTDLADNPLSYCLGCLDAEMIVFGGGGGNMVAYMNPGISIPGDMAFLDNPSPEETGLTAGENLIFLGGHEMVWNWRGMRFPRNDGQGPLSSEN